MEVAAQTDLALAIIWHRSAFWRLGSMCMTFALVVIELACDARQLGGQLVSCSQL